MVRWMAIAMSLLVASVASADERKIGIITDLTGHGAFWGKQTQLGITLLEEDLRHEGLDVKFVFADSSFKPAQGVSEAQKLIAADQVDALFVEFSSIVNAVSPIAKSANKLIFGTCAATSFLKTNPYAVKMFLDYDKGCRLVGNYWKGRGIKKVGVMRVTAEPGDICSDGVASIYPDVVEGVFKPGDDVMPQLLKMKAAKVEAIFATGYEVDTLNLLRATRTLNLRAPIGGPNEDVFTAEAKKQYPTELEGAVTFGFAPVDESFLRRVLAKSPSNTLTAIEGAANAYLFAGQLARALIACKKADVDCQLEKVTASGPDPLLGFQGWKERKADHNFVLTVWEKGSQRTIEPH